MSFQTEYYKPLCDYLFALLTPINSNKYTFDEEIIKRDFVSRSYYTALLHCREQLGADLVSNNGGSHEQIILSVHEDIQDDLKSLKNLRVQADYKTAVFPSPLKVKGQNFHLNRVQAIVKNILTLSHEEIKKDS